MHSCVAQMQEFYFLAALLFQSKILNLIGKMYERVFFSIRGSIDAMWNRKAQMVFFVSDKLLSTCSRDEHTISPTEIQYADDHATSQSSHP